MNYKLIHVRGGGLLSHHAIDAAKTCFTESPKGMRWGGELPEYEVLYEIRKISTKGLSVKDFFDADPFALAIYSVTHDSGKVSAWVLEARECRSANRSFGVRLRDGKNPED